MYEFKKKFTLQGEWIFEKARSIMKNLYCNKKYTFLPLRKRLLQNFLKNFNWRAENNLHPTI